MLKRSPNCALPPNNPLPRAQVFVSRASDHRAVQTQVWKDKAGNHFTGCAGTIPITKKQAERLLKQARRKAND